MELSLDEWLLLILKKDENKIKLMENIQQKRGEKALWVGQLKFSDCIQAG